MKKYIKASKADTFLKYHDDADNYYNNEDGFNKMYEILNQYGDSNEDVDVVFRRATPEDQDKMLALITPNKKVGQSGYAKKLYRDAVDGNLEDWQYAQGVVDAFEALFREGYVSKDSFKE